MVESVNKHIKYYYLFKKELKDFEDTVTYLSTSVPDKDNYQQDMIEARKNRLIECCENK